MTSSTLANRRRFLQFLAASSLASSSWSQQPSGPPAGPLADPRDALNVMDFEEAARKALPPAHWGYMATGVDDDLTLKANREGFRRYQLRPRRLEGVTEPNLKTELFGKVWDLPIFLCPVGSQRTFHPEGELAVARAAKSKRAVQILSTVTAYPVEEVAQALGEPPWYQLYMPARWDATEKMVRRVEAAGCPVLAWTVDLLGGRNTETMERFRRADTRTCTACHATARGGDASSNGAALVTQTRPMLAGLEGGFNPPAANWDYVDRLKKMTRMKLVLKGIETREDARMAREHGVDGILLSNHGGRATETGRGTIECLAEVVDGAGPVPVLIDGGFRRGTDVYKALALGARAVGIGRPYIWGLSAFGQKGVERVLDILRAELQMTMKQCGSAAVKDITRACVTMSEGRS